MLQCNAQTSYVKNILHYNLFGTTNLLPSVFCIEYFESYDLTLLQMQRGQFPLKIVHMRPIGSRRVCSNSSENVSEG